MSEINLKYRTWLHGQPVKRSKLLIPGWAGDNTWETPQPWHCKPWSDCATYGLEIPYTWEAECIVTGDRDNRAHFEGDFAEEIKDLEKDWYPFAAFAPGHYGYVTMIDIKTPPNHNLMIQPHPRVFSDRTGEVPIAVPGMLEMDWWPEIFFMVFKTPLPGERHVFRKGDPLCSFYIMPRNVTYNIEEMDDDEKVNRAIRQETLEKQWHKLCTRVFYCKDGVEFFDNKYKVFSNIAARDGINKAEYYLDNPEELSHWDKKPEVKDFRPKGDNVMHHIKDEEDFVSSDSSEDSGFSESSSLNSIESSSETNNENFDFNSLSKLKYGRK